MKRASIGLGNVLLGVCVFASSSGSAQDSRIAEESAPETETVPADKASEKDVCPEAYNTPLGELRRLNSDCYNAFIASVAREEEIKTFTKKRNKWHILTGELQLLISGSYTNTGIDNVAGSQVLLRNADGFYRFEGGWVEKKLLRDLWVVFKPEGYLRDSKRREHLRNLLIDAIIVTAKGGWGQYLQGTQPDLTNPADPIDPQLRRGGVFTAGVAYKLSLDKVTDTDID